jgi:hypothetical protein
MLRKTYTAIATAVACGLLAATAAQAAPLDKSDVAKDAKWVIHVDLEALTDSKVAEKAGKEWPQKTQKIRQRLESEMGITPQEDLRGLTMFSNTYEMHSGVAILNAKFERQKVKSSLESKQGVKKTKWDDYTLYTYDVSKHKATDHQTSGHKTSAHAASDDDHQGEHKNGDSDKSKDKTKTVTTAIVDRNTLVCAASPERVKWAIKLLENESESLAKADDSKLVKDADSEALIYASAVDLDELPEHVGALAVLRQHKHACYTLKERDGKLKEQLALTATDKEIADKMKEAAQGLVALLDVWTADADKLNEMVTQTEIKQDGDTLHITWQGTPGDAITAIEQIAQHAKEAKQHQRK